MAEFIQKTDTLNQGREKLNAAITDAEKAKTDAGSAVSTSNQAKQIAQTAEHKADSVQAQFDQVIIEGDSSVEAAAARIDEKNVPHPTLKARIDEGFTDEAHSRIQADERAFYKGLNINRDYKPMLTIVDDDVSPQVWTKYKPILEQEKVPITFALITSRVGTSSSLTIPQLKQLQRLGAEFVSHTHTHIHLAQQTPEVQDYELRTSYEFLKKYGFSTSGIVYPFGSNDATTRAIARKYYDCGVHIDGGASALNQTPVFTYRLERVYLENGIALAKQRLDEAIASNGWMIYGTHAGYDTFDENQVIEIIQYAKSKGVEIVSLKKGIELYGNIIDLPNFQVDAKGDLISSSLGKFQIATRSSISNNAPLSYYPQDAVSYRGFTNQQNEVAGFVNNKLGMLFTYRSDLSADQTAFQEWLDPATLIKYRRFWNKLEERWGDWQFASPQQVVHRRSLTVGTVNARSTKDVNFVSAYIKIADTNPTINVETIPPAGIMFNVYAVQDGQAVVRVANLTDAAIDLGTVALKVGSFYKKPI